jgi:ATP-binding protein involved in chromosome partitioning
MFRQVKVEILGMLENMSHFVCPHCHNEVDIFSKGGAELTAKNFGVPFLGRVPLEPGIRKGGDSGAPIALLGEESPHGRPFFEFARRVIDEAGKASKEDVIQIR